MRFYPILLASPRSEGQRDERVPWSTSYLTPLQMRDDLNRSKPAWSRSHRITQCRSVMDTADHVHGTDRRIKKKQFFRNPTCLGGRVAALSRLSINESEGVLMLTATVIRRLEALGTISQQGKRLNGLFRLMENPILWYEAYANIYANDGALTKGVDEVTLDGFSQQRVASIIARLKAGTYRFK